MKKAMKLAMLGLCLCTVLVMISCPSGDTGKKQGKFSIYFINAANGAVIADAETAAKGQTVTLTVKPNAGYRLSADSLVVIGLDGSLAAVADDTEGNKRFSFVMPNQDVTVASDFELIPEGKFTFNLAAMQNGTVTVNPETAANGQTVTLTVKPDAGYRLVAGSLTVTGFDGALSAAADDAEGYKRYTFTMPGNDVSISCNFELIPEGLYTVNLAAMQNGTVAISVSEAALGDTVTLTVKPNENFEYTAASLKVNDGTVSLTAIADDAEGFLRFTFLMPGENVTVKCSFEKTDEPPLPSYNITVSSSISHGTVYTSLKAKAGDEVIVTVKANNDYAYQESSLKINGSADGIVFIGESDDELWFKFTMPAEDVTITCAFDSTLPVYYTITTSGISSGTVSSDPADQAVANTLVTLTVKANTNYEYVADSLKINSGAVAATAITNDGQGNKRFTFTMPAANVTVTCTFAYNGPAADYFSKNYDESLTSFSDKFDTSGANHTAGGVNLNKWGFQNGNGSDYGNWGWGNNERQSYRTENVTVVDGILTINAKYQTGYNGMNYTSGKIVTANSKGNVNGEPAGGAGKKFGQTYGRFEAKIRMNAGIGAWPAFWMMPVNSTYGGWPKSGEIDIVEMTGNDKTHGGSTLHIKPDWNGVPDWQSHWKGSTHTFLNGSTWEDWHVFGVLWSPTEMTFLLDGYKTRTITANTGSYWPSPWYAANGFTGNPTNGYPPFNHDFHFIINFALDSGDFKPANGIANNLTTLNYTLEVEWVRAYTLQNDPWPVPTAYPGTWTNHEG